MILTRRTRQFPTTPMTISIPNTATSSHLSASGHGRSINQVSLDQSLTGTHGVQSMAEFLLQNGHIRTFGKLEGVRSSHWQYIVCHPHNLIFAVGLLALQLDIIVDNVGIYCIS